MTQKRQGRRRPPPGQARAQRDRAPTPAPPGCRAERDLLPRSFRWGSRPLPSSGERRERVRTTWSGGKTYGQICARRKRTVMRKDDRLELRLDAELRAKVNDLAGLSSRHPSLHCCLHCRPPRDPRRPQACLPERCCTGSSPACPPGGAPPSSRPVSPSSTPLSGVVSRPKCSRGSTTAYARGYIGTVTDELVDAVITTVLHIAPVRAADPVAILAPPDLHTLVVERVKAAKLQAAGKPCAASIDATIERMKMGLPPA